jgi:hypothetical protein
MVTANGGFTQTGNLLLGIYSVGTIGQWSGSNEGNKCDPNFNPGHVCASS